MDATRIAAANYHYKRYTLGAFLRDAAESGYSSVELWASGPQLHLEDFDTTRLERLKRDLQGHGLAARCLTPEQYVYPISLSHPDPIYRQRSVDFFIRHVEAAATLECGVMVVSTGRIGNSTPSHGILPAVCACQTKITPGNLAHSRRTIA